ncbi:hypothetical protein Clacol_009392 [Clathrus columnatus]|uniref:Ribophorin II third domain-containing protein n=1 Tax=Clathrus columnatus TaxID=1419009 RepID=A0AAV5AMZ9_9AGAM|nr:hypothetical protein Clacol_009392 [Clathrus columnatus]
MRFLHIISLSLLPIIASAGKLSLQSARVVVSDTEGTILRNEPLSKTRLPSPALTLDSTDTLKFTVQILDDETGKPVQPHQTFLRFYDAQNDEEGIQPLRVSSTGKASFELNMAKPPASIPATPDESVPLRVSLIVGSFEYSPLSQPLFDLHLPVSRPSPKHPEEHTYAPLPEIQHTFRPEPKTPYVILSAIGTGLVLSPWVALIGLLGDVLLYGAIFGGITIAAGKSALGKVGQWRLAKA